MSTRKKIETKIERKKEEIQDYESKVKEAVASIQAYREVLKMLPRDNDQSEESPAIRAASLAGRARSILRKKGSPMHINKLLEANGMSKDKRQSLSGTLAHYVRREEIFTRPSPGTFGLVEFGEEGKHEEPPEDFGVMDE